MRNSPVKTLQPAEDVKRELAGSMPPVASVQDQETVPVRDVKLSTEAKAEHTASLDVQISSGLREKIQNTQGQKSASSNAQVSGRRSAERDLFSRVLDFLAGLLKKAELKLLAAMEKLPVLRILVRPNNREELERKRAFEHEQLSKKQRREAPRRHGP
ncbi:MAG: hypothetical protein J5J00_10135 [Deltaproteobacteria bacterium]|nr:hypothetical protein [Deltaproteobacteria bacterium]